MNNTSIVSGVDIGGSHITAAQVDLERRRLVPGTLIRKYVNAKQKANYIIEAWSEVINNSFVNSTIFDGRNWHCYAGTF
jgi:glucokinase